MHFRWIKDFSAECKTINLLGENSPITSEWGSLFKTMIQNPKAIREIVDKLNSLKKKKICMTN